MKTINDFKMGVLTGRLATILIPHDFKQYVEIVNRLARAEETISQFRADKKDWHQRRSAWKKKYDALELKYNELLSELRNGSQDQRAAATSESLRPTDGKVSGYKKTNENSRTRP